MWDLIVSVPNHCLSFYFIGLTTLPLIYEMALKYVLIHWFLEFFPFYLTINTTYTLFTLVIRYDCHLRIKIYLYIPHLFNAIMWFGNFYCWMKTGTNDDERISRYMQCLVQRSQPCLLLRHIKEEKKNAKTQNVDTQVDCQLRDDPGAWSYEFHVILDIERRISVTVKNKTRMF